jgi:hypothetical protein
MDEGHRRVLVRALRRYCPGYIHLDRDRHSRLSHWQNSLCHLLAEESGRLLGDIVTAGFEDLWESGIRARHGREGLERHSHWDRAV